MRKRMSPNGHAFALRHSNRCMQVVKSGEMKWQ